MSFEVKGVLKPKGISGWMNQDDLILVPSKRPEPVAWPRDLLAAHLKVADESRLTAPSSKSSRCCRTHKLAVGQENDFNIRSMSDVGAARPKRRTHSRCSWRRSRWCR